jgi:hypothetical protein
MATRRQPACERKHAADIDAELIEEIKRSARVALDGAPGLSWEEVRSTIERHLAKK